MGYSEIQPGHDSLGGKGALFQYLGAKLVLLLLAWEDRIPVCPVRMLSQWPVASLGRGTWSALFLHTMCKVQDGDLVVGG